jgi:hypothetical protein
MTFLNLIVQGCSDTSSYFYSIYLKVYSWIYPFYLAAPFFYSLSTVFADLAWGFYDFNIWVDDAVTKLGQILSISTITSYFQTWIGYATTAYNWIINAANIILLNISAWWNTTQQTVLVWIDQAKQWALAQINNLAGALAEVQTWWNSFKDKIPSLNEIISWFTNWWANILSRLSSWWIERLLDIKALFNSWTLELAPLLAGWQEIRDKVFEFFNDPLEWLLAEFTDWFLGKE